MRPLRIAALICAAATLCGPADAASSAPAAAPAPAPTAVQVGPATPISPPIPTATSAVVITLGTAGDFQRKAVTYGCEGQDAPIQVDYLNAAPNYLALIPIDGSTLVFNTVLSASGARYAAGKYIWSTKGPDASLYDLTQGANAKPVLTCTELNETP